MTSLSKTENFSAVADNGSLTELADGTYLAVWGALSPEGGAVFGQVFNADGTKKGAQFTVVTGSTVYSDVSAVQVNDGRIVVAWVEDSKVKGRVLAADDFAPSITVDLGFEETEAEYGPKLYALDDGGFSVLYGGDWDQDDDGTAEGHLFGSAWKGPDFTSEIINIHDGPTDPRVAEAVLPNGRYIALQSTEADGETTITAYVLGSGGIISQKVLVTIPGITDVAPSVTALPSGDFVAAWEAIGATPDERIIHLEAFTEAGNPAGFSVDFRKPASGSILEASVTKLSNNGYAVAVTMDVAGSKDVYVMSCSADGLTVTDPVFVGTSTAGDQTKPSIIALANGSFVVSWTQSDSRGFHFMSEVFTPPVVWVGTDADEENVGTGGVDDMDGLGGHDKLMGHGGNDILKGGEGNDTLEGGSEEDDLRGGNGNDILDGGTGSDRLDGGTGDDIYLIDNINDVIVETTAASGGNDRAIIYTSEFKLSDTVGIERIEVGATVTTGVRLTGNHLVNTLIGGVGSDTLDGGGAPGGAGERLQGGKGDDLYYIRSLNDVVVEAAGEGTDSVILSSKSYDHSKLANIEIIRYDISGAGRLDGGAHDDTLKGGDGGDTIDGGAGIDWMIGGKGDDVYYMTPNDVIVEEFGGGRDTIIASFSASLGNNTQVEVLQAMDGTAALTLGGANMNDTIIGNAGANTINGGSGNDTLEGRDGTDMIFGDLGADRLVGGLGADTLDGGEGADIFVFNSTVAKKKNQNIDKIVGFNVKDDSIYLENAIFKKLGNKGSEMKPAKLSKAAFWVGTKAHDANDRIIYNKKKGVLLYDEDGTGRKAAIQIAILDKNIKKISEKDFFII